MYEILTEKARQHVFIGTCTAQYKQNIFLKM